MTAKEERRGRPRVTPPDAVAYHVRVSPEEADAFDELVRRRSIAATGAPTSLSAAAVLRGLMRQAVEAEGIVVKPSVEAEAEQPKPKKAKR